MVLRHSVCASCRPPLWEKTCHNEPAMAVWLTVEVFLATSTSTSMTERRVQPNIMCSNSVTLDIHSACKDLVKLLSQPSADGHNGAEY